MFDIAFLEREFARALLEAGTPVMLVRELCQVLDTLSLARERHPGQRNSLDALCKRYNIDNSTASCMAHCWTHACSADVYLAMTGGQSLLALDESRERAAARTSAAPAMQRPSEPLLVLHATAEECAAHAELRVLLAKASGGACLWNTLS